VAAVDLELEAVVVFGCKDPDGDAVAGLVPEQLDVDAVARAVGEFGPPSLWSSCLPPSTRWEV
jgi:hypothetical protein